MRPGLLSLAAALAFLLNTVVSPDAAAGPTPYPENKADYPGKGPTAFHPWFNDNRNSFWQKREQDRNAIVFAGSSAIGNWKNLKAAFPNLKVANRGIGGDVTRGLLFRFQEDVLDLNPRAIVLLIGQNDLSAHANVEDVLGNLELLLDMAAAKAPNAPVILCTHPPRDNPKAPLRDPADLARVNEGIFRIAQGRPNVSVLDLFPVLAAEDGKPHPDYFVQDRMHISPAGYAKFQEAVQKEFDRLQIR
jgi:lysophospholipase L1-like esterase